MSAPQAEGAREAERQRIAADFHDGPLQSFISFQMRLEVIKKLMARDKGAAEEELRQLQDLCRGQVADLRGFVRSMRPVDEGMSLSASLSRMVESFQRDAGIFATFTAEEFYDSSATELALEILQIVRETLNNIQKHSGATRVAVTAGRVNQRLEVSVEDNGAGFPFSGKFTLDELELLRLGPISIKRRVRMLGGGEPDHRVQARGRLQDRAAVAGVRMRLHVLFLPAPFLRNWRKTGNGAKQFLTRLVVRAAPFALLCGCGRYADFTLPEPEASGPHAPFAWQASAEPVLGRGPEAWDSVDALNPSVFRFHDAYWNLYSGFDGRNWSTGAATPSDGVDVEEVGQLIGVIAGEGSAGQGSNGSALVEKGEFLYWYVSGDPPGIALARSRDGVQFETTPKLVVPVGPRGSFDECGARPTPM